LSSDLFGPSLTSERMRDAVSDTAWVQAMLDVEAGLARAEARVGVIPTAAANAISAHCNAGEFDIAQLGRDAVLAANPVNPLVSALRAKAGKDADFVHRGATSQDILDSAMMLIARRGIDIMLDDLGEAAGCAATLADRHRSTLMAGRTLMQQALVTTFGLKVAGWLVAILEARESLAAMRDRRLAVQFGGAVGTLAALSDKGVDVTRELARELRLAEPPVPWHTNRTRIAELGSALAITAGVAGKVALDVVLLAQSEVNEVRERRVPRRGGSSTLPQKRNPVTAVEILAAVRGVNAQTTILIGTMAQEHERSAGAWQAEWPAISESFRLAGGAASRLASLLSSLEIDAEQMRHNVDIFGGLLVAEQVVMTLAAHVELVTARQLVDAAVLTAAESGRSFKDVLQNDPAITAHLDDGELRKALDPVNYLGVSGRLIDRALEAYRAQQKGER
jgi:3-carboxy-cis,cis-muconate cycloisomerase